MLPPIARVSSPEPDRRFAPDTAHSSRRREAAMAAPRESPPAPPQRTPYRDMDSGFIGGVALRNYRRGLESQSQNSQGQRGSNTDAGSATLDHGRPPSRQRPVPAPINTTFPPRPSPQAISTSENYRSTSSSFITPTDLHNPSSKSGPTGRRPPGTRLITDPHPIAPPSSQPETQKTRKGLPFLRNPMSTLLLRRRNGQAVPDVSPLPLRVEREEPAYDPRIRGTRVHDFSAPRRREQTVRSDTLSASSDASSGRYDGHGYPHPSDTAAAGPTHDPEPVEPVAAPNRTSTRLSPPQDQDLQRDMSIKSRESGWLSSQTEVPPPGLSHTSSFAKGTRSRNISLSSDVSVKSRLSGVPKHMKSTSSRFSFDMIGAAKQEKALEDRHRQRELERGEPEISNPRDSRFDDFDDDSFDYDAMMDDDGLEERIPGINADGDDEEDEYYLEQDVDPDNDQVNFSGFSFQRSEGNLPSAESSGAANAVSETQLGLQESLLPHGDGQMMAQNMLGPAGLGIEGVGTAPIMNPEQPLEPRVVPKSADDNEDLYFDDGMTGFEDEFSADLARPPSFDGTPFDESIFDNNDTDQYGRPIAGAFAQAQSERQAAQREAVKRESDMTSRFSAQSGVTRSTTHTSLSTGGAPDKKEALDSVPDADKGLEAGGPSQMVAYQAALAAAAHKAAASGKFQWEPETDSEMDQGRKAEAGHMSSAGETMWQPPAEALQDNDEFGYENMDDFELDDDAIIAEANASALANDSDGWYGQEFGFYSASANNQGGLHRSSGSVGSSRSGDGNSPEYQYANGGVFGPKGVDGVNRTKSGRVISREPNLTPITERSEYSNRNSVMSMALPGHGLGTPIQSPGLAQLAMMADTGDEMSLSSLLRLRSRAWGGSQASLNSSREGSPKSDRGDVPSSPWTSSWNGHPATGGSFHGRKGSILSGVSLDSEPGSDAASPTVMMAGIGWPQAQVPHPADLSADSPSATVETRISASSQPEQRRIMGDGSGSNPPSATSPMDGSWGNLDGASPRTMSRRSGMSHRSKSSADSISYTMEEESGETRWVIERRRVAESGEVEMEREVVEGGRI